MFILWKPELNNVDMTILSMIILLIFFGVEWTDTHTPFNSSDFYYCYLGNLEELGL